MPDEAWVPRNGHFAESPFTGHGHFHPSRDLLKPIFMKLHSMVVALWIAAVVQVPAVGQPAGKLLPTAMLEHEIAALPSAVQSLKDPVDASAVRALLTKLQGEIGAFIIRQIEVYPSISKCEFQKQLADAFEKDDGTCGNKWYRANTEIPRVFVQGWGPTSTRRVFVVTYSVWLGTYGPGGSETVLESYVWEREGNVHRAASTTLSVGSDTEEVCWFPKIDTHWVLAFGTSGTSGRALTGTAAVFELGPDGAKTVWSAPPDIGNVRAHAHALPELRWEIDYVDMNRFYANLPDTRFLDIFEVVWDTRTYTRTYRRLVHQPLD